jgi:hypothetical protein
MRRIKRVVSGLEKKGLDVNSYFETSGDAIDASHYREHATTQLDSHRARANDKVFKDRFVKGYTFTPLPRFRGVEAVEGGSFDDFVHSLCESMASALSKRKKANRMVRAISEQFRVNGIEIELGSGKKLFHVLRCHWPEIGAAVKAFYQSTPPSATGVGPRVSRCPF